MIFPDELSAEKIEAIGFGSTRIEARDNAIINGLDKFFSKNILDPDKVIREVVFKNPLSYIEQFWILKSHAYPNQFQIKVIIIPKKDLYEIKKEKVKKFKNYSKVQGEE